MARTPSLEFTK